MTPVAQLLLMLAAPLAPLALALLVGRGGSAVQTIAAHAALPALLTSLLAPSGLGATLPWLLQGSELGLDDTGRTVLCFSAAIWLACGIYARGWLGAAERRRFFVFFLLVMSGNLGLIVAQDILTFYLFFALMSFAAYGLIVHDRSQTSRHAARVYITLMVAADMLLYAALVLAALDTEGELLFAAVLESVAASPHGDLIIALLVIGFGVKVGLLGLHVALPLIYAAAPTPAAAALAGAVINAGLLGWLRLLPHGEMLPGWSVTLVALGLAAACYGVVVGLAQRSAAVVLGYSSVSQLGIMTAAVGVALRIPGHSDAIAAAVVLFAMHHAFVKSALFLTLGVVDARGRPWARRGLPAAAANRSMIGVVPVWPPALIGAALLLPSLALVGAPLTSGMLAKEHLKHTLAASADPWSATLAAVLPLTSLLTTLIVARFLWLAWPRGPREPLQIARRAYTSGWAMAVAWVAIVVLAAAALWIMPVERPPVDWGARTLWNAVWPIGIGAAVATGGWVAARSRGTVPQLPPGDLAIAGAYVGRLAIRAWMAFATQALPSARSRLLDRVQAVREQPLWARGAGSLEQVLGHWSVATALFIMLIVVLVLVTRWF